MEKRHRKKQPERHQLDLNSPGDKEKLTEIYKKKLHHYKCTSFSSCIHTANEIFSYHRHAVGDSLKHDLVQLQETYIDASKHAHEHGRKTEIEFPSNIYAIISSLKQPGQGFVLDQLKWTEKVHSSTLAYFCKHAIIRLLMKHLKKGDKVLSKVRKDVFTATGLVNAGMWIYKSSTVGKKIAKPLPSRKF